MLWTKTFHIIFVVTWFAGIFYLPRLFVYHAQTDDSVSNEKIQNYGAKALFWNFNSKRCTGAWNWIDAMAKVWLRWQLAGL